MKKRMSDYRKIYKICECGLFVLDRKHTQISHINSFQHRYMLAKRLGLAPPLLPHHAAASELLQPTLAPLEEQSAEGSESDSQLDRSSMSTKPGTPPAVSFQSPLLR